jgi:hypothetical protein
LLPYSFTPLCLSGISRSAAKHILSEYPTVFFSNFFFLAKRRQCQRLNCPRHSERHWGVVYVHLVLFCVVSSFTSGAQQAAYSAWHGLKRANFIWTVLVTKLDLVHSTASKFQSGADKIAVLMASTADDHRPKGTETAAQGFGSCSVAGCAGSTCQHRYRVPRILIRSTAGPQLQRLVGRSRDFHLLTIPRRRSGECALSEARSALFEPGVRRQPTTVV